MMHYQFTYALFTPVTHRHIELVLLADSTGSCCGVTGSIVVTIYWCGVFFASGEGNIVL